MIKVLIVDDHPVVRWGFRQMLATDPRLEISGEIENGDELLDRVASINPDIILLDIRMPGVNGIQAVKPIRERCPSARIIIFTVFNDAEYLYDALASGVDGYLLKTVSRDVLVDAIHTVYIGKRLVDPSLVHLVLDGFTELAKHAEAESITLSSDERQLLDLLASGATVAVISTKLNWSPATVNRRIRRICKKLGVKNRAQAMRQALELGLI